MADEFELWHLPQENSPALLPGDAIRALVVRGQSDLRKITSAGGSFVGHKSAPTSSILTSVRTELLDDLLRRTMYVIKRTKTDSWSEGALLVLNPNSIAIIATDGHRLSVLEKGGELLTGIHDEIRVFLLRASMESLSQLVSYEGCQDHVEIRFDSASLQFRSGGASHRAARVKTCFPPFERYLGLQSLGSFVISVEYLRGGLEDLIIKNRPFTSVAFVLSEGTMHLWPRNYATHLDLSAFDSRPAILSVDWRVPDLELSFSLSYLLDFILTLYGGEKIRIEFAVEGLVPIIQMTAIEAGSQCDYRHLIAARGKSRN